MFSMKNIKEHLCASAGCTVRHLDYILSGKRNASPRLARILEGVSNIPAADWILATVEERRAAWERAKASMEREP